MDIQGKQMTKTSNPLALCLGPVMLGYCSGSLGPRVIWPAHCPIRTSYNPLRWSGTEMSRSVGDNVGRCGH